MPEEGQKVKRGGGDTSLLLWIKQRAQEAWTDVCWNRVESDPIRDPSDMVTSDSMLKQVTITTPALFMPSTAGGRVLAPKSQ